MFQVLERLYLQAASGSGRHLGSRSLEGRLRPGAQGLQMGRGSKLDVNDTKEMR
jgi:hypothetical protein